MFAALVLAAIAIPPRPSLYVTDNAHVLSAAATQRMSAELQSYEATTQHHVIVWIGESTAGDPLEDWTIRAAEKWKVGRPGYDDGAILFIFMADRKVRIEVGYGLESALTDASAAVIIRDAIVPRMRSGDVDGAVQAGVDRVLVTITPSFSAKLGHALTPVAIGQPSALAIAAAMTLLLLFFTVFIGIFAFAFILQRRQGTTYGGSTDSSSGSSWSSSEGGSSSGSFGGDFGGGGASGGW